MLYKIKKYWFILVVIGLIIYQVCATETTPITQQLTLEEKQNIIIKNLQTDNFNLMLILLASLSVFTVFVMYLFLSKILYFGNMLRQCCRNKRVLLFILTSSGYKLKQGVIYDKKINGMLKYYIKYDEGNKTIEFPLIKEHIIRPEPEEKHFLPLLMLISKEYSVASDELQITKLKNDINMLIKNKENLKNALEKYHISNEEINKFEEKLNSIQEKIDDCEKKIETSFKKEKRTIIYIIKWIIEELQKIKDIYKNTMMCLIEESKHRNELSMKDALLNIYSDVPFKMDFSKFALLISQIDALSNLMEKSIPKTTISSKKIFVIVGVILLIFFIVFLFFIINQNPKIPI